MSLPGKLALAFIVVALWTAGVFYYGRQSGKAEQLTATVQAYKTRGKINAATDRLDDYQLCLAAGGLPDQCDELRRLDPAAKGQ